MDRKRGQDNDSKKPDNETANIEQTQHKDQDASVRSAHDQAEKDISEDAELSAHSPNDDLDEGETARLGEGSNPLV